MEVGKMKAEWIKFADEELLTAISALASKKWLIGSLIGGTYAVLRWLIFDPFCTRHWMINLVSFLFTGWFMVGQPMVVLNIDWANEGSAWAKFGLEAMTFAGSILLFIGTWKKTFPDKRVKRARRIRRARKNNQ